MKRLALRPSAGGELSLWERPVEDAEYIVTCDPSLGRMHTEKGDHSAIGVWRRWPGQIIEQVCEWWGVWPAGRVGEVIACLARAYGGYVDIDGTERGCAIVNIERNLMEAVKWAMVEGQEFSEEFLFIPRNERTADGSAPKVYFTNKDSRSEHYLINTLIEYLDRKAIVIRSARTLDDIRSLEKRNDGGVTTNGKDLAVMAILACVTDQELPAPHDKEEEVAEKDAKDCPPGFDRELWAKKYGKPKKRLPSSFFWKSSSPF